MKPSDLTNGKSEVTKWIYKNEFLPDTKVEYSCNDGLTMVPDNFAGRICGYNKYWNTIPTNGITPSCVKGELKILQFTLDVEK